MAAICTGCGSRKEYRASELNLERRSWDSIFVDVSFARHEAIGGSRQVSADQVLVTVFDEEYQPIYSGEQGLIPIPDSELGNGEKLTFEACGEVRSRQICVQKTLPASPKRVRLDPEIEYPTGQNFARGRFSFRVRAERERFGGSGWEAIKAPEVRGSIVARVEDAEDEEKGIVSVPFSRSRGAFDLSRDRNFRDFKYYLESALLDRDSVSVRFDILAGLGSRTEIVASVVRDVQSKSDEERLVEVRDLVEQALAAIVDELGSFLGAREAVAYIDEWAYDQPSRSYRVTMEAVWDGPILDRGHYELKGVLEVREDGTDARFTAVSGNRRAERRWRDRTDANVLRLEDLEPASHRRER